MYMHHYALPSPILCHGGLCLLLWIAETYRWMRKLLTWMGKRMIWCKMVRTGVWRAKLVNLDGQNRRHMCLDGQFFDMDGCIAVKWPDHWCPRPICWWEETPLFDSNGQKVDGDGILGNVRNLPQKIFCKCSGSCSFQVPVQYVQLDSKCCGYVIFTMCIENGTFYTTMTWASSIPVEKQRGIGGSKVATLVLPSFIAYSFLETP